METVYNAFGLESRTLRIHGVNVFFCHRVTKGSSARRLEPNRPSSLANEKYRAQVDRLFWDAVELT